jgi:nucleolar protein 4
MCCTFPELANIPDNGSDDGTSEENLVGEDDSSELDQDISDRPSEDDFKTEVDISRKVLENLIKSEKSEPPGIDGSDIDTDTETENDTSENKKPESPVAGKSAELKRVDAKITDPASKPDKKDINLDRTIFISNLPFDISNEEVTVRFSVFGKVESFFPVLHKLTKYV